MRTFALVWLALGLFLGLAVAVLIIVIGLQPAQSDLESLVLYMLATGGITTLVAYSLYRLGVFRRFTSLRWTLSVGVIITVLLVMMNVWGTAQLMFFDEHDLNLTLALLMFSGVVAITFGVVMINTVVMRIRNLSQAAGELAGGKLNTRLDVLGQDEVADLTQSFNWMASSLETTEREKQQVEQSRRELIAGVSHDLRTPLTSIRAILEAISDGIVVDPNATRQYVGNALDEVDNLNRLIEDLFELSQINAGQLHIQRTSISLRDMISDVISNFDAKAKQRHIVLEGIVQGHVDPMVAAPDKLQRVFYNLVENALRYTPPEGNITISAQRHNGDVNIDVHNTGSLIPEEHLPHIFDSFYRVEPSRVQSGNEQRSTGLGLAIVRGIVEAHDGKVWVESTLEHGTTFHMQLPQSKAS